MINLFFADYLNGHDYFNKPLPPGAAVVYFSKHQLQPTDYFQALILVTALIQPSRTNEIDVSLNDLIHLLPTRKDDSLSSRISND